MSAASSALPWRNGDDPGYHIYDTAVLLLLHVHITQQTYIHTYIIISVCTSWPTIMLYRYAGRTPAMWPHLVLYSSTAVDHIYIYTPCTYVLLYCCWMHAQQTDVLAVCLACWVGWSSEVWSACDDDSWSLPVDYFWIISYFRWKPTKNSSNFGYGCCCVPGIYCCTYNMWVCTAAVTVHPTHPIDTWYNINIQHVIVS